MVPDFKFVLATEPGKPSSALSRYDLLWRYVIFTDVSTVILEWGSHGQRKTLWTLNRLEPAEPDISERVVAFEGRAARLYSTVGRPTLRTFGPGDGTGSVRVLEYDCGDAPAAFAFSDDTFQFGAEKPLAERTLVFSDSTGTYRIVFPDRLIPGENPGNCSISAGELFWQIKVEFIGAGLK
jgi:hypothetical protein